jgi:hypothetical protein
MSDPISCQIERIDGMIKRAELYAQWWIARAISGEVKSSLIYHGGGKALTDEEKIKEAIQTANIHIGRIEDLVERKIELMKQLIN